MNEPVISTGTEPGRRTFLKTAAVAAGGALVSLPARADHPKPAGEHPKKTDAAFEGVFVTPRAPRTLNQRKNIAFLPDAELDQLREAFRVLRANNDAIYTTWVNIHVENCQHDNDLIWPWHRAYLYYFELRLQQAVPGANPPVTLPFWSYDRVGDGTGSDTVEFRRLPSQYRPQTIGDQPNPLWVSRRTAVNDGTYALPFRAVQSAGIVAGNADFESFTANLESQPHNNVHNLLGYPMMDRQYSPSDPVFWLHHSNLDRALEAWRAVAGHEDLIKSPSLASWRRTPLPGFSGSQFPRRLVEDVLQTDDLGYSYVDQVIPVALKPGEMPTLLSTKDVDFGSARRPPAAVPALRPVRIRFAGVRPPGRMLQARVFLGVPGASADTRLDDAGFVGMFTLYPPHTGHGSAYSAVTLDLDVTDAVQKLIADKMTTKFPISVVVVQFDKDGKPQAATVKLEYKAVSVEIGDGG
jgi:hypothetical protein